MKAQTTARTIAETERRLNVYKTRASQKARSIQNNKAQKVHRHMLHNQLRSIEAFLRELKILKDNYLEFAGQEKVILVNSKKDLQDDWSKLHNGDFVTICRKRGKYGDEIYAYIAPVEAICRAENNF